MNQLLKKISNIQNNATVLLEKDKIYDVYEDDCIFLHGYYCSNTASKQENPDGFRKAALWMENKQNITIDGNGATILIHGIMTPIVLRSCKNITIKNLKIDYFRPTMSQFTVLKNDHGNCVLSIHPESLFEIRENVLIWCGEKKENGEYRWEHPYKDENTLSMYYEPMTNRLQFLEREENDKFPSVPEFSAIEQTDTYTLKVRLKNSEAFLPEGSIVQSRNVVRDQIGGFFEECKNLKFENLRVMFFHGLGMLSQFCENITFKNCDFTPKKGRTFVSNADGFQFSGCKGKILIENNRAFGNHDDFINIHGTHLQIEEAYRKENALLVRFANESSWGFQAFHCGDIIEFVRWNTLCPYFRAKVLRYERLNDTQIKLFLKKLPSDIQEQKDVIANLTYMPSVIIRKNYFGYTAARSILCTTSKKVVISNNVFEHNAGPALLIEDDCNFWFESGYTKHIVFKNNKITDCGFLEDKGSHIDIAVTPQVMNQDMRQYVHGTLKIVKNSFIAPDGKPHQMRFQFIRSVRLKKNRFDTPLLVQKTYSNVVETCL